METKKGHSMLRINWKDQPMNGQSPSTVPRECSQDAGCEALSTSDVSDHEGGLALDMSQDQPVEDVVGFSIGQEQLRMKSPETPALEKAKALDQSKDYFDLVSDDRGIEDDDPDADATGLGGKAIGVVDSPSGVGSSGALDVRPPPSNASQRDASQSSAAKSILKDGFETRTRSASSGSTGVLQTVKRLLPELTAFSLPKAASLPPFGLSSKAREESQEHKANRSSTLFSRAKLPWPTLASLVHQPTMARDTAASPVGEDSGTFHPVIRDTSTSLHASLQESDAVTSFPSLDRRRLRRATSESSLFVRNDLEKTTTRDDLEKWANVSEQVSSRFKAITDSLQDSAIGRLPKMPSVNLASFKPGAQRSRSDEAKLNTERSVALTQLDAVERGPVKRTTGPSPPLTIRPARPILDHAMSELYGDVVVLGGYRGSILRSAKPPNKQLWVPVKVGINLRRVDLEVGLNAEDEEKMPETIIPSGVLSHIGLVDICRRLLRHLQKCSRSRPDQLRVHDYGYDWRLSPHLLSQQLITFLEALECNSPAAKGTARGAVVIAHSLGGLITRHAVNRRPDLFAGVVYAGVPQHCINILGPLRNGDDVLLSSRVLTAQVNFTLRTSYVLLPESGRCFINKNTGERYDVDFFDVKTWEDNCLSPCVSTLACTSHPEQRRGIIGTITDGLPSLPFTSKRALVALDDAKEAIKDTGDDAAQKTEQAQPASATQTLQPSIDSRTHQESVSTACTLPRADALTYLERTLKSVGQFKQELAFQPPHQTADVYPPIAVLYSDSVPTVFAARVESREAIKRADVFDHLAFAPGDGVVLSKAARPPVGYRIVRGGLVRSERGHIGLLGDLEAVGQCLQAVTNARKRGVGTGKFAEVEEMGS